ncbi:MAG: hypothetical protein IJE10_06255 [Clostridia bacterium]|nr:hypothetical protein [Clostridia bacterium]
MKIEKNYDFRKKMLEMHTPDIRDMTISKNPDDFPITDGIFIVLPENCDKVVQTAAKDLQDFLFISMRVSATLTCNVQMPCIRLMQSADLGEYNVYKGCRVTVNADGITVSGFDSRGIASGIYQLETKMRDRKAPFIPYGKYESKPMFSPMMVHSGYGLDEFPDGHLNQIAHEGRDAILVYTRGINESKRGFLDFNNLIERAAKYGIDVYAYSDMHIMMHPEAEGARAHYDSVYGKLFESCPGLKGVTLVGESVGFPSKDPHVTGVNQEDVVVDGIPTGKVSSGWYPCMDYPDYVNLIKEVIREKKPDVDIVLWTYNWGFQPEKERVALIEKLPTDISLLATFEMFEPITYPNGTKWYCADYTLSFAGPGAYFKSEAIAAKKRGIRLYSMTNTGGLTWDMGCIPYQPAPYQWIKRCEAVISAHDDWGLCGIMEGHHYGFYPSFISRLTKEMFDEPRKPADEILDNILESSFGKAYLQTVKQALILWSEASTHFIPSDADQYGAFRIGTSYPLCVLNKAIQVPRKSFAKMYVYSDYLESINGRGSFIGLRIGAEIESLKKAHSLMQEGLSLLDKLENQNEALQSLINLGHFMAHSIQTGIHAKELYVLQQKMRSAQDKDELSSVIDRIEALILAEKENALQSIPYVQKDSRLGWEPRMEYSTDEAHIRWKIRHSDYVLEHEIPTLRKSIQ